MIASGSPLSPSQTAMHTSATPRPKDFRQDGNPELGTGYAGPRGGRTIRSAPISTGPISLSTVFARRPFPCISPLDMVFLVSEVFIHFASSAGSRTFAVSWLRSPFGPTNSTPPGSCLREQLLSQLLMVHLQLIHGIECFGHRLSLLAKLARRVGPIEFNRFPDSPPVWSTPTATTRGLRAPGAKTTGEAAMIRGVQHLWLVNKSSGVGMIGGPHDAGD